MSCQLPPAQLARALPVGENKTSSWGTEWELITKSSSPEMTSQSITFKSREPVTNDRPSGEKDAQAIPLDPRKTQATSSVFRSRIWSVLPRSASIRESAEKHAGTAPSERFLISFALLRSLPRENSWPLVFVPTARNLPLGEIVGFGRRRSERRSSFSSNVALLVFTSITLITKSSSQTAINWPSALKLCDPNA